MALMWVKWFIFLASVYHSVIAESRTNFKVKRFGILRVNPSMKFFVNITVDNDRHYLNYDVTLPVPADEHMGVIVDIETVLNNKTVIPLFVLREKYMCKAANQFYGEFWYDIVRASTFPPKVCPIPAGRYHGLHVYLDFRKISLQTFPFGTLRFTVKVIDNRKPRGNNLWVELFNEVENIPN